MTNLIALDTQKLVEVVISESEDREAGNARDEDADGIDAVDRQLPGFQGDASHLRSLLRPHSSSLPRLFVLYVLYRCASPALAPLCSHKKLVTDKVFPT